jgi:hypothetical protein
MRRAAPGLVVALALAGCGGSGDAPPRPAGPGSGSVVDLRSADARSPLVVAADGVWRCPTEGRLALAVSEEGEASLTVDDFVLASVAPIRSVVNRVCDRVEGFAGRGAAAPPHGRLGAATVRCGAPATVLVGFRGGDITVRAPDGRFVAGAAVRADRIGIAAYWGARCTTL